MTCHDKVVSLAKNQYSSTKLEPALKNLENASARTLILQEDMQRDLKCDSLYRCVSNKMKIDNSKMGNKR